MKIFLPAVLLYSLGILVIQSVSKDLFVSQFVFGLFCFIVFWIIRQLDYRIIFSFHLFFTLGFTLLLIITFILGELTRGAYRWLNFGLFSFQPSELIKPFILISFVAIQNSTMKIKQQIIWYSVLTLLPLILIFLQPDLGTFLVIVAGLLVIFFSRWTIKHLLWLLLFIPVFVIPIYNFALQDYQKNRLISFINPYSDPLGNGYHVIQSIISVGSGGLLGKGLGQGSQSQLHFLPEQHTDFIFASLSEELGFVGAIFTLVLYGYLFYQVYRISQISNNPTATFSCLGVLGMLGFQVFVNIGMNLGVAPVTGVTLPFVSYGGSSLLSSFILLGLVSSISRQNRT